MLLASFLCFLVAPGLAAFAQQYPSEKDLASMSIEQLAQVKVFSASRHLENSMDAPSAVSVITADEIARYGWRTLADVLRSVRGFYTAYDRDYTYLGVRGFLRSGDYNSRILLMVNGHRLNDKVLDSAQVGTEFPLDLDLIDHIEIVRGPSSSLFGTNAVFGVINIITRQPGARAVLQVSGDNSSFLGRTGQANASFQQNGLSVLLSASRYRSAGQERLFYPQFNSPETNGGIAEHMDGDRYDHAFADLQWGDFRLQGLFSNRVKAIPAAAYQTIFNNPGTRSKDEREYLDLSYHHSVSSKTDFDLRVHYDSYKSLGVGVFRASDFGSSDPASTIVGYQRARSDWVGTEGSLGRQIGRQRIAVGTEFEYCIRVDQKNYLTAQPPVLDDHHTPRQGAVYAQTELNLLPKLTISAGGRLDWFDTFGGAFSPRLAAIYSMNPRTSFKYIFGRAFRAPNAYESYYVDTVVVGEASPNLRPENIQSHEVVLQRSFHYGLQVTADVFYNSLKNLIDQAPDPANGLTHFVNTGRDRGRGLELEVEAKRKSGLLARASYTLADARNTIQSVRLANSPLHTAKVNASIPLGRQIFAGLEMFYSSAQKDYHGTRVPPSFLTNATFSTRPIWGGWQFSASCYNAFDRRWFAGAGPENQVPQILQDGRTYRFKASYRLPLRESAKTIGTPADRATRSGLGREVSRNFNGNPVAGFEPGSHGVR